MRVFIVYKLQDDTTSVRVYSNLWENRSVGDEGN